MAALTMLRCSRRLVGFAPLSSSETFAALSTASFKAASYQEPREAVRFAGRPFYVVTRS
jgi:hypothetical protein